MKHAALALALIALAAAPQEPVSIYAFPPNEKQPYEVIGEMRISLAGSHKDFIEKGNEVPLKVEYRALFENVVVVPGDKEKPTALHRKVKKLTVTGEYKGEALKVDYDPGRSAEKQFIAQGQGDLVEFFRLWCATPAEFKCSALGKVQWADERLDRLMIKAGMMYWQVQHDTVTWDTTERIAVPLLHHKISVVFHNKFVKTETEGSRKLMIIEAKPEIAAAEAPGADEPKEIESIEPTFKAGGSAKAQIDLTQGRLHSLRLNLKIEFSGHAPVSDGAKGTLRGEVNFTESQVYKEKP
ncbi:MAG TPA: hypothetical protein VFS19_06220 [Planctomycetota bacterium]|nr:hypothetical protein [Planctomycetota bacterium]